MTTKSSTEFMLAMYHFDRGINAALELEMILRDLKKKPENFNSSVADQLIRSCCIIKSCIHDCLNNSEFAQTPYPNLEEKITTSLVNRKKASA